MKNNLIVSLLAVAVFSGMVFWSVEQSVPTERIGASAMKIYSSQRFGFSFEYPARYFVDEREVGNGEREHYAIVLAEDTPENRAMFNGTAIGARDGPPTIAIDIYQNNLDRLTALAWTKNTSDSNFKLGDGTYSTMTFLGAGAVSYRASGLYELSNLVLAKNDRIYKLSVAWLTPRDGMMEGFKKILQTIEFN